MYKPKFTPEIYHLMSVFVKLFPMHFFAYVIIVSCYSDPTAWGLGEGPTTGHRKKKQLVTKCYIGPWNWRALVNTVMNLRVL